MAEIVPFKQKFLMKALPEIEGRCRDSECCLFADVTQICSDKRHCVRHNSSSCTLPDHLHIFNGGFRCKSFSKLNNKFELFQKAIAEANEDELGEVN